MKSLKYLFFAFVICLVALNNVLAESKTCKYNGSIDNADLTYQCVVTDNGLSCRFTNSSLNITYKSYSNGTVSDSNEGTVRKLQRSNFINSNGDIDCNEVSKITFDLGVTGLQEFQIFNIDENVNGSIAKSVKNVSYIYAGTSTFNLTNSGTSTPIDPDDNNESGSNTGSDDPVFDTDNFCSGSVLNIFTAIGWVIQVIKIAIPLILIIFGSIDFGKAIIASKDDEVKKAGKSLVMRVIAGVIIFFIPTIVNFVITLIGGEDIYNGSDFGACTECMLNPSSCGEGAD